MNRNKSAWHLVTFGYAKSIDFAFYLSRTYLTPKRAGACLLKTLKKTL